MIEWDAYGVTSNRPQAILFTAAFAKYSELGRKKVTGFRKAFDWTCAMFRYINPTFVRVKYRSSTDKPHVKALMKLFTDEQMATRGGGMSAVVDPTLTMRHFPARFRNCGMRACINRRGKTMPKLIVFKISVVDHSSILLHVFLR